MIGGGGPNDGRWIGPMARPIKALLASPFVSQRMGMMMAELNHNDLAFLADLMESGKVTPVIDRTYKLADLGDAIRYLEQGHARGKVIITVD
jgi:NADPH:quinone reductase-like Zn-dependent oxidoreductase